MKTVYILSLVFNVQGSNPILQEIEYPTLVQCIEAMYEIQMGDRDVGVDLIDMKCRQEQKIENE